MDTRKQSISILKRPYSSKVAQAWSTVSCEALQLCKINILVQHKSALLQEVFKEVMDMLPQRTIRPVGPIHEFSVSEVEKAFRSLQSGKLMGKLVIVPKSSDTVMVSDTVRADVRSLVPCKDLIIKP